MKTLKIEIDCDEKTCGKCYKHKGNPPYCGVFNVILKNEIVVGAGKFIAAPPASQRSNPREVSDV